MDEISSIEIVPLRKITTKVGSGATPRGGKESYIKNGISLIRSQNVYDYYFDREGLAFIDEIQANELDNVTVERNDILLNITGASVARCCKVPDNILPARVNQHVSIIRVNPSKADYRYVLYALNSPQIKKSLLNLAQGGATREALTKEKIENFDIPLPKLNIQHKIGDILSSYDDLIINNTRRIQILEELAQSIYREWFVNFRFPGYQEAIMVESEHGLIPEGWGYKSLETIAHIQWGDTSITKAAYKENGYDAYSATGLDGKLEYYDYERTGIVISAIGANCGKIWYASGKWSCIKNTLLFWATSKNVNDEYFYCHFNTSNLWPKRGAAQPFISLGDAQKIKVLVSTEKVMGEFKIIILPIFSLIKILRTKNSILRNQRDLLLPKLISGEIEV